LSKFETAWRGFKSKPAKKDGTGRKKYQDDSRSGSNKCIEKTSFQRQPAATRKRGTWRDVMKRRRDDGGVRQGEGKGEGNIPGWKEEGER